MTSFQCLRFTIAVTAFAAWSRADSELETAFSKDNECAHDATCSLHALQLKGTLSSTDEVEDVTACCSRCGHGFCSPMSGSCHRSKSKPYYKDCSHIAHEASKGCSIHEERIAELWETCASPSNKRCGSCGIYNAMRTPGMHGGGCHGVVYVGEKVVPKEPVSGGEGVTLANAAQLDNVWNCAVQKDGHSPATAHIMNPWMARTQHHLHVIVKPLDSRGLHLAKRLERATGCMPGQWHDAHFACHHSKARLYEHMPPVFSEVFDLAQTGAMGHLVTNPSGEQTLATVGISVLFICGGKPVILTTGDGHGGCSVEHAMT